MKPIGIIIWTEKISNLLKFYEMIFESKVHKLKSTSAYFVYNNLRIYISEHSEVEGDSKDPNRMIINFETEDIEIYAERDSLLVSILFTSNDACYSFDDFESNIVPALTPVVSQMWITAGGSTYSLNNYHCLDKDSFEIGGQCAT